MTRLDGDGDVDVDGAMAANASTAAATACAWPWTAEVDLAHPRTVTEPWCVSHVPALTALWALSLGAGVAGMAVSLALLRALVKRVQEQAEKRRKRRKLKRKKPRNDNAQEDGTTPSPPPGGTLRASLRNAMRAFRFAGAAASSRGASAATPKDETPGACSDVRLTVHSATPIALAVLGFVLNACLVVLGAVRVSDWTGTTIGNGTPTATTLFIVTSGLMWVFIATISTYFVRTFQQLGTSQRDARLSFAAAYTIIVLNATATIGASASVVTGAPGGRALWIAAGVGAVVQGVIILRFNLLPLSSELRKHVGALRAAQANADQPPPSPVLGDSPDPNANANGNANAVPTNKTNAAALDSVEAFANRVSKYALMIQLVTSEVCVVCVVFGAVPIVFETASSYTIPGMQMNCAAIVGLSCYLLWPVSRSTPNKVASTPSPLRSSPLARVGKLFHVPSPKGRGAAPGAGGGRGDRVADAADAARDPRDNQLVPSVHAVQRDPGNVNDVAAGHGVAGAGASRASSPEKLNVV